MCEKVPQASLKYIKFLKNKIKMKTISMIRIFDFYFLVEQPIFQNFMNFAKSFKNI